MQSSPLLVLDSSTYVIMVASVDCPDTTHTVLPPIEITLTSQKAYFILVSGQPLRAKLVSSLVFIADQLQ